LGSTDSNSPPRRSSRRSASSRLLNLGVVEKGILV